MTDEDVTKRRVPPARDFHCSGCGAHPSDLRFDSKRRLCCGECMTPLDSAQRDKK